ncbi:thrombomodulin [Gadus chalcogrammus]|uniref:thrombomodulin n=1 Tax=Gadus chalcogrammus TaxID=1042646 RepID=UPI0024C4BCF5|nr:thrombomodulin [Gadus chalcogrammus]
MFPLLALLLLGVLAAGDGVLAGDDGHCDGTLCFAVFSKPADFQTARDQCSEFAGHLMTVQTADSNAVLRGLLRGSGPHWVGLSRAAGCQKEAGPLRGFRWDTGDTGSDFSNWDAAAADRSGCARRCVSVSSEDGFKWSVGSCDARAAGFLCEYRRRDACEPPGLLGTYTHPPYAGRSGDAEPRPHGTIFTRDSDGATSMCLSGEWVRTPWPCGMKGGGCEFECGGTEDHPVCLCPPGRAPSGEDPAVCAPFRGGDSCRALGCAHGCGGAPPTCACRPGFLLGADGRSCREAGPAPRGLRSCDRGYRSTVADDCVDVDECQDAPCEHDCTNTRGSFTCSCFDGYRRDPGDPLRCQAYCGLAECPAECDPNEPEDCSCPIGYILDVRQEGGVCMDLDECNNYHCDQLCKNSYGNYTCSCLAGFSLVGGHECVLGTVPESFTLSYVPTSDPAPPKTDRLSAGGLVAVVVAVAVVVFLAMILVYHFATRRSEGRAASPGGAGGHNLEQVASGLTEKAPALEE